MRLDFPEFEKRNTGLVVLGPDSLASFQRFWTENELPFVGLADVGSHVAQTFAQEVNLLKLGRMPAQFVIDAAGKIRYAHYGTSMADIPPSEDLLAVVDELLTGAETT